MRRIIVLCLVILLIATAGCGSNVVEQDVITNEKVSVEIFGQDDEYEITPQKDEEKAPSVEIGSKAKIKILSDGSKISEVIQYGYFDEDGYYTAGEVNLCFTKLPDNECSYEMCIPKGKTFKVSITLQNDDTYYFALTRTK